MLELLLDRGMEGVVSPGSPTAYVSGVAMAGVDECHVANDVVPHGSANRSAFGSGETTVQTDLQITQSVSVWAHSPDWLSPGNCTNARLGTALQNSVTDDVVRRISLLSGVVVGVPQEAGEFVVSIDVVVVAAVARRGTGWQVIKRQAFGGQPGQWEAEDVSEPGTPLEAMKRDCCKAWGEGTEGEGVRVYNSAGEGETGGENLGASGGAWRGEDGSVLQVLETRQACDGGALGGPGGGVGQEETGDSLLAWSEQERSVTDPLTIGKCVPGGAFEHRLLNGGHGLGGGELSH